MTLLFLLILILTMVIVMPIFQQPIPSSMVLLFLALLSTTLLGFMTIPWYGYLLFLIYVSGMLVVFGYVCAMTPNVVFLVTPKVPLVVTLATLSLILPIITVSLFQGDVSSWKLGAFSLLSGENLVIYWMIAMILLVMLVITVYVVFKKASPLRGFDTSI
uniref:NADH dehydrogenase subunit 6 n=1 Tax=Pectinatella magnifica TaxID=350071 RepID=A0A344AUX4_9BILA|nr:NADH dehydrogenase subunit 6 [Pectinatella magnifica]AWX65971.1 NADH dehydrogenase subunit 6 [Pectinatella magnifica]